MELPVDTPLGKRAPPLCDILVSSLCVQRGQPGRRYAAVGDGAAAAAARYAEAEALLQKEGAGGSVKEVKQEEVKQEVKQEVKPREAAVVEEEATDAAAAAAAASTPGTTPTAAAAAAAAAAATPAPAPDAAAAAASEVGRCTATPPDPQLPTPERRLVPRWF